MLECQLIVVSIVLFCSIPSPLLSSALLSSSLSSLSEVDSLHGRPVTQIGFDSRLSFVVHEFLGHARLNENYVHEILINEYEHDQLAELGDRYTQVYRDTPAETGRDE